MDDRHEESLKTTTGQPDRDPLVRAALGASVYSIFAFAVLAFLANAAGGEALGYYASPIAFAFVLLLSLSWLASIVAVTVFSCVACKRKKAE